MARLSEANFASCELLVAPSCLTVLAAREGGRGRGKGGPPTHSAASRLALGRRKLERGEWIWAVLLEGREGREGQSRSHFLLILQLQWLLPLSVSYPSLPSPSLPPFWMDMRLADSILTSEVRSPQQRIKDKSCPTPTALFEEVSPSLSLANGIV